MFCPSPAGRPLASARPRSLTHILRAAERPEDADAVTVALAGDAMLGRGVGGCWPKGARFTAAAVADPSSRPLGPTTAADGGGWRWTARLVLTWQIEGKMPGEPAYESTAPSHAL